MALENLYITIKTLLKPSVVIGSTKIKLIVII